MSRIECQYCKKEYKTISSLNHHIKTAKFCLSIQKKEIIIKEYKCEFCKNIYKNKRNLQTHIITCKAKSIFDSEKSLKEKHEEEIRQVKENFLKEINEQKIYIASLEAKIEIYERDHNVISDIAKQTKITNTNTSNIVNNLAVYDIDKITENFSHKLEYITKEDIMNGQKGIANILAPCLYDQNGNKMITCSDKARLVFTRLDENNQKTKDVELKSLVSVIKPLALQKADAVLDEHNKLKAQLYTIENLKCQNKDYRNYIQNFQEVIDGYRKSNTHKKLILDYEKKIRQYQENIRENEEMILSLEERESEIENESESENESKSDENKFNKVGKFNKLSKFSKVEKNLKIEDIEIENEKLLDGHTEIQYLDKEPIKFARQISKMI